MSRRAVLAAVIAGAAATVTACAAPARGPAPVPTPAPAARRPLPTAAPAPVAVPSPPAEPTAGPAQVAAEFAGRTSSAWGMALPGIHSTLHTPADAEGRACVAWTFDACGGASGDGVDHALLDALREAEAPATLFLNARWIERHSSLAAELAADPLFLLANHGTAHLPLSVDGAQAYGITGTASVDAAVAEVWGNHQLLTELIGSPPRYFRSGTAHYDDVAVELVHALGERPIGFTVNGDGGATYGATTVHAEFLGAEPGGIVLVHMNRPDSGTAAGVRLAVADVRARGIRLVHVDC